MLEVAAEDRAHPDVLAQPRHPGAQAADAAHDQVDLHAGGAGLVQRLDQLGIAERVQLGGDPALGAERRLVLDEIDQLAAQVAWRDEQRVVVVGPAVAGEVVEQLGDVVADRRVAGEEADVLVQPGGSRVVVAGADVAVAAQAVVVGADHQHALGVGLQARRSRRRRARRRAPAPWPR